MWEMEAQLLHFGGWEAPSSPLNHLLCWRVRKCILTGVPEDVPCWQISFKTALPQHLCPFVCFIFSGVKQFPLLWVSYSTRKLWVSGLPAGHRVVVGSHHTFWRALIWTRKSHSFALRIPGKKKPPYSRIHTLKLINETFWTFSIFPTIADKQLPVWITAMLWHQMPGGVCSIPRNAHDNVISPAWSIDHNWHFLQLFVLFVIKKQKFIWSRFLHTFFLFFSLENEQWIILPPVFVWNRLSPCLWQHHVFYSNTASGHLCHENLSQSQILGNARQIF